MTIRNLKQFIGFALIPYFAAVTLQICPTIRQNRYFSKNDLKNIATISGNEPNTIKIMASKMAYYKPQNWGGILHKTLI